MIIKFTLIILFLQMVKIENGISMEKWKKYF